MLVHPCHREVTHRHYADSRFPIPRSMRCAHILRAFLTGAALLGAVSGAYAVEGTLTLYTSQPNNDAQQTVDAFMAKYPDVEVTFVRDGTTMIMAPASGRAGSRLVARRPAAHRRQRDDGRPRQGRAG